jgi:gas vesicle protein
MIEFLAGIALGLIAGGIIGIFFYRNNTKAIAPIAEKVDTIKDSVDGIKNDVKELKK